MHLLLTGAWRDAARYISLLEEKGHSVVYMPYENEGLPCDPAWVEGVVCNSLFVHHSVDRFTALRMVQLTSAGLDRVPVEVLQARGIALYNARGVYSIPMAEHAMTMALQLYRNSRFFLDNQSKHLWEKDRSLREICGKTVCIIGCGSVGTECAKRFGAFGCRVIGVDTDDAPRMYFETTVPFSGRLAAVGQADIVVLTLPLTPQTEGMADAAFFASMQPGAVLIQLSRGKIVQTAALLQALQAQELYAALDVFEEEPLCADSPLWTMENVILTPHNSFVGDGNSKRLTETVLRNIRSFCERGLHENTGRIT